ncbi:MAG TPA: IgGFc-binding protein [Polyangiaceae bacterium]
MPSVVACGSTLSGFGDAGADGSVGADGGPIGDASCPFCKVDSGPGGDSGPQSTCSPDLHEILDPNGNVITTCPADQGCAGGQCVAACDAAAAAKGSVGCDFMVATPSFFYDPPAYSAPCFAIFLANNWGKDTVVTVDRAGVTYDATKFGRISAVGTAPASWGAIPVSGVPQSKVAVLFMDDSPSASFACPVTPAIQSTTEVSGTGRGQAWHIKTSFPVSAYDILPFGGAASYLPGATLLYPTTAWGTNYIAALPKLGSGDQADQGGPHWGQIVAFENGTTVDIVPTVALPSGTNVSAAVKNVKTTYTLAAGEYVQWQPGYTWQQHPAESVGMDMSGSIISSNNPIAFNGGNGYLCLGSATSSGGGCDSDHEQIAPIQALGSLYTIVPFEPRAGTPESVIYDFTGIVDGTQLTYDPPQPTLPTKVDLGQKLEFESTKEFVVKSQDAQHPFHVALMMPGSNGTNSLGDEDYVQMVPPAQFLASYVFYSDVTYSTTNFTVVRNKTSQGFQDVTIDCVGTVTGWKPVDAGDTYEYAWVDIVKGGVAQHNNCQNGPHTASSKGPFGITVWGEDSAASYGYPAGGNLSTINSVIVPPVPH